MHALHVTAVELKGHSGYVLHVAFSPDGQRAITASLDKTKRLWNADGGQLIAVLAA